MADHAPAHELRAAVLKSQCLLPCAETACLPFWAVLASGQITMRKADGWPSLHVAAPSPGFDLAA